MTTTGGSTSTKSPAPSAAPTVRPRRRLSTAEYRRIIEEGILRPGDRVELIEGEMLLMPPTSNDHTWGVTRLNRLFMRHEAGNFVLQTQSTIHLAEGFSPDPDFILLQPREDDYRNPPATARDVLLVIEVSISSLRYDLQQKARLYAQAMVPELWVLDVPGRTLHQLRNPGASGYREHTTASEGQIVSPQLAPSVRLAVADILPPNAG